MQLVRLISATPEGRPAPHGCEHAVEPYEHRRGGSDNRGEGHIARDGDDHEADQESASDSGKGAPSSLPKSPTFHHTSIARDGALARDLPCACACSFLVCCKGSGLGP